MNIESKAFVVQDIFNIVIEPLSTWYDFKSKPAYYSLIDSLIFYQRKGESKLKSKWNKPKQSQIINQYPCLIPIGWPKAACINTTCLCWHWQIWRRVSSIDSDHGLENIFTLEEVNESYSLKFCYVHIKFKEKNKRTFLLQKWTEPCSLLLITSDTVPKVSPPYSAAQPKVSKVLNYVTTWTSVSLFRCSLWARAHGWLGDILVQHPAPTPSSFCHPQFYCVFLPSLPWDA